MATLQTLPEDAKRMICIELYRENSDFVRPLWAVSKSWRAVAEAFVYRNLVVRAVVDRNGVRRVHVDRITESDFIRKYMEHTRYVLT